MTRGRLFYNVGVVANPGNPFGRSELVIELDGTTRLVHRARGGVTRTWIAIVVTAVLDAVWTGLERARFPEEPAHPIPGGSTMRDLRVEMPDGLKQVSFEWHAATKFPGYAETFKLLDQVIRQISGDSVELTAAATDVLATEITPA